MYNLLLYSIVFALVVWVMDGVNINSLFKKNRVYQAKTGYVMIIICLTYLITNFVIEFSNCLE